MLSIADQLNQLAISTSASPSKPKMRHTVSSASGGNLLLNPYSPSLTPAQLATIDTSLSSAVAALVHHLTSPLAVHYSHSVILHLRSTLTDALTEHYERTWRPLEPSHGTGSRSLICNRTFGLPRAMKLAAQRSGVSAALWISALKGKARDEAVDGEKERDEWEAWCDPGMVCWRYGSWKYFDAEFDPVRPTPESIITIWQAGPVGSATDSADATPQALTPARPSAAITIRAPSVSFQPPTPAHASAGPTVPSPLLFHRPTSPNLMPAASIGSRPAHSRSSSNAAYSARTPSPISEADEISVMNHSRASTYPARAGHRHSSGSSSSIDSTISDSNSGHTQLLTPASRPGSADPFTAAANAASSVEDKTPTPGGLRGRDPSPSGRHTTPTAPGPNGKALTATPSVTPYDGGNVTVLGGGVKLGGGAGPTGSRPGSVVSQHRMPMVDRSRSPSVSLASRALSSAILPGEAGLGGGHRKSRTRRRIMPTYLGYVGQPGVGGPVGNAFQPIVMKGQPGQLAQGQGHGPQMNGQGWQAGVGVGIRQPLTRIA